MSRFILSHNIICKEFGADAVYRPVTKVVIYYKLRPEADLTDLNPFGRDTAFLTY